MIETRLPLFSCAMAASLYELLLLPLPNTALVGNE
jgi:hypothetical protein